MRNVKENKIHLIRLYIIDKLNLVNILDKDNFILFLSKFTNFLRQNRYNSLLDRSENDIKLGIDNFISFCSNLGLSKKDMISVLSSNFLLLSMTLDDELLNKYILLSVYENEENTFRKDLLLNNSKVFNQSIEEMYARYSFDLESGRNSNYNYVLSSSYNSFIKMYIKDKFINEEHKILNQYLDKSDLINKYPIDFNFINSLKSKSVNYNVSYKRIKSIEKIKKIRLAIDNYYKVSNLSELSKLLNISTSSLQRYLQNDSKDYISDSEYRLILNWLSNAKAIGKKSGGKKSQEMYGYKKDEEGHFIGRGH